MATILLRTANSISHTGATVKGTPLTNSEVDNNFSNINITLGVLSNLSTSANANLVAAINSITYAVGSSGNVLTSNGNVWASTSLPASGLSYVAKSANYTLSNNEGVLANTASGAFTITLPASPSAGDTIILLDYAGTFDTNALTVNPNSNKIEGGTSNLQLTGDREGVTLTYIDATQGWLAVSGIQEGTDSLSPVPIEFLVVGGGGGTTGNRQGGGGAGGYRTSSQVVSSSTVITVTVGA
jgi:hypothetical protein